jgi:broad specificity phosphatase PhoE
MRALATGLSTQDAAQKTFPEPTKPCSTDARWYWFKLANRDGSALVLKAAGGDETRAAQIHAWAQNPEYKGKEVLVSQLFALQDRSAVLRSAAPESQAARGVLTELRGLADQFAAHRAAFTALPPRTIVDTPADPMRPVPNLKQLNARAKAELPKALVSDMKARGFDYVNTATLVNIRHGQTDGNVVSGGYFAGGLPGPWGAQLTPQAKDAASRLVPELKTIAPYIGAVIVSPTDRAGETYRRATQGVSFPKNTAVTVVQDFSEHHVGGLFGLKKPAKGTPTVVSKVDGLTYGRSEDGAVAIDKNPAGTAYVPALTPYLTSERRMGPVRSEPRAESWEQMYGRVSKAVDRDILPQLAAGKNVLVVSHQFVIGNQDAFFFSDAVSPGLGRDARATGHDVPNTAPQYWPMHVFRNAQTGKLVVVPAIAGQGQLAAPGVTPSGQTPKP